MRSSHSGAASLRKGTTAMRRNILLSIGFFLGFMALFVGIGLASTGGQPEHIPTPTPYPSGWTYSPRADTEALGLTWAPPKPQPLAQRKVYVVIGSGLSGWNVASSANWVDKYTGSDWVVSKTCPASAYRCIFVKKDNGLRAPVLAATYCYNCSRVTIKVDVRYASPRYRSAASRKQILAHEFAHAGFLGKHVSRRGNLMCRTMACGGWALLPSQKATLARH